MSKYDGKSYEELADIQRELKAKKLEILEEQKVVRSYMDKRLAEDEIRRKVENMSDAEKEALHQYVSTQSANGIGKGEKGVKNNG